MKLTFSLLPTSEFTTGGTFKNTSGNNITHKVLLGLFESVNFNKFLVLGMDDGSRILDMYFFDLYKTIVDCCGEVQRISSRMMAPK